MDISLRCVDGLQPSMNQECPDNAHLDDLINEIENSLSEALHIEEDDVKCASNVDGNSKVVLERNESDELDIQQSKCFLKCLNKSATFPFPSMALPADASADGEDKEPPRNAYPRSISLLVSVSLHLVGVIFAFIIKLFLLVCLCDVFATEV